MYKFIFGNKERAPRLDKSLIIKEYSHGNHDLIEVDYGFVSEKLDMTEEQVIGVVKAVGSSIFRMKTWR